LLTPRRGGNIINVMFGYIEPLKPELKLKEYEAYKGYYCGLCKAIKEKYTNAARFMLNYDCATLSLLLSSMSGDTPEAARERCAASPFKPKTVIRSRESGYAATVNVLLGFAKLLDNARDEKRFSAALLIPVFAGAARRAEADCPELAGQIRQRTQALRKLESERCSDVDEVAEQFALILAAVFSMAPFEFAQGGAKKALWHFGYNLGRWIYVADALNDMIRDEKTGSYNVFLIRGRGGAKEIKRKIRGEAEFSLNVSLSESCKAYELLDIKRDKPLMDNIMYLGLAKKTQDVLKGETDGSV